MSRKLVAFFSASGVTAKVAAKLAKAAGADLFEIVPEVRYTRADLNYMNRKSRSSVEMNDKSCRPAIADRVENMADYDVVFVGFPVWWYREPSIIDTFIEQYDFSGKVIVPFCTSGSSDIGKAPMNILNLAPDAYVKPGKRFPKDVTEHELEMWASAYK